MRRGFDVAASTHPGNLFLFNLPATHLGEIGRRLFREELDRLGRFLRRMGGKEPTNLRALSCCLNGSRSRTLDWCRGATGRTAAEAMTQFLHDGTEPIAASAPVPRQGLVPIILAGGPVPQSQWPLFDTLDRAGAHVAVNATENGERALAPVLLHETAESADSIGPDALAEGCLNRCVDIFQRPNTRLYDWLRARAASTNARGIVLWSYINCDLWRAEAASLRELLHLPVLALESHETLADTTRARTRIEAFVEALQ
jgi:benzoyl-CoA reductase/2-hydroxyglutaryl-CoA dehydratase subunit BcrC/BadD/HgdB